MSERRIRHLHRDLIPRWMGEDRGFDRKLVTGDPERNRATSDRIRAHIAAERV
ncbi:MAG: hypothetical protein ACREKR_12450 [Candidatus Methylomirabilales bacterium]